MRGEYPCPFQAHKSARGSPPLARGVLQCIKDSSCVAGITPACAGSTGIFVLFILLSEDHPRLRGEYRVGDDRQTAHLGSPPLARGVRRWRNKVYTCKWITPACAGSTLVDVSGSGYARDHPRLRGEYFNFSLSLKKSLGSPPLARGVLLTFL